VMGLAQVLRAISKHAPRSTNGTRRIDGPNTLKTNRIFNSTWIQNMSFEKTWQIDRLLADQLLR